MSLIWALIAVAIWMIAAAVVFGVVGGGIYVVYTVLRDKPRIMAIMAEDEAERSRLQTLDPDKAYARAEKIIARRAVTEPWTTGVPAEVEAQLRNLDPGLGDLLRRYRRIHFRAEEDSPMELSAEFFAADEPVPEGHVIFGMSVDHNWIMCARPGDTSVYEVIDGLIRGGYPTVAHYILLTQDE